MVFSSVDPLLFSQSGSRYMPFATHQNTMSWAMDLPGAFSGSPFFMRLTGSGSHGFYSSFGSLNFSPLPLSGGYRLSVQDIFSCGIGMNVASCWRYCLSVAWCMVLSLFKLVCFVNLRSRITNVACHVVTTGHHFRYVELDCLSLDDVATDSSLYRKLSITLFTASPVPGR